MNIAPVQSFAQRVNTVERVIDPGQSRHHSDGYQQTEPAWVDPAGDASLIRLLDRVPEGLTKAIWQHMVHGEEWDQREVRRPEHVIGEKPAVQVPALLNKLTQMIQHEPGIKPTIGKEHTWSAEAKSYQQFGFLRRAGRWIRGLQDFPAPTFGFSKLFLTLACGCTSRFTLTGQEEALTKKVMAYPDGAVGVDDMFCESYRLNQGDLYKTLMTAENLLARDPFDPRRSEQPLQKKLAYIRNDQPQVGDNFAAWYHLFGMATYALVRPEVLARGVEKIEALGSFFTEGADKQEDHINRLATDLGVGLKKIVESGSWKQLLPSDSDLEWLRLDN